jgi:hypothetical protein
MTSTNFELLLDLHCAGEEVKSALMSKEVFASPESAAQKLMLPFAYECGSKENFSIRRMEASDTWAVSTKRHMLYGVRPLNKKFPIQVAFHELLNKDGRRLTSDMPVEVYSQFIEFSKCGGHVLIGGLGLGMAAEMILLQPQVTSVTVIELEKDIIDLVKPQVDPRIEVVHADLYEYLHAWKPTARIARYDSAYFDIWYETGELVWEAEVVPLYRLARKIGINNLSAWGESEMKVQLISPLYVSAMRDPNLPTSKSYLVFLKGLAKVTGRSGPFDFVSTHELKKYLKLYVWEVGTPEWEEIFGGFWQEE